MFDAKTLLKSNPIFGHLSPEELDGLSTLAHEITLNTGEVLFYRGDKSRDLYILTSGKLEANTSTQTEAGEHINCIIPNEIVGEMAMLAGLPRSLTIIAVTPVKLLKISHEAFTRYCQNKPKIAWTLLAIIAKRTRGVIEHYEHTPVNQYIAFFGADDSVPISKLLEQLNAKLTPKDHTVILSADTIQRTTVEDLPTLFLALREKYRYILYPLIIKNEAEELLIRYADKLTLIGFGSQPPSLNQTARQILATHYSGVKARHELILLYQSQYEQPHFSSRWLKHGNFFRHHHIYLDSSSDIERLKRFMTGQAVGLVLSGGGLRGSAHLGAIQAIQDAGLPIDAIGGTSVGAIVGAVYLESPNLEIAVKNYQRLHEQFIKTLSFSEFAFPTIAIYTGKSATQIGPKMFGQKKVEDMRKPYFCTSCNMTRRELEVTRTGLLWQALRATISLPCILPPMIINNEIHVDGAAMNNLPVDVMLELLENSGEIISVSLSSKYVSNAIYSSPPIVSFLESVLIKLGLKKNYRFESLFSTIANFAMMGSYWKERKNLEKSSIIIEPDLTPYDFIGRKNSLEEIYNIGYMEAEKAIKKYKTRIDQKRPQ